MPICYLLYRQESKRSYAEMNRGESKWQKYQVVITGLGAISPLGSSLIIFWDGLVNGRSGVRRITQFDPSNLPCQIAGEIPDFNPKRLYENFRSSPVSQISSNWSGVSMSRRSRMQDSMGQCQSQKGQVLSLAQQWAALNV